jgi:hypothetical protein
MRLEHAVLVENGVTYEVALKRSREGYAVWVPKLPGANSQGATVAEAVEFPTCAQHPKRVVGEP